MTDDEIIKAKKPALAVDVILFTIRDSTLMVGLVRRDEEPYSGKHALPGRMVRYNEPIETTASKALELKGGVNPKDVFFEQLYTFGEDLHRDTRIRVITCVYYGLVDSQKLGENKFCWHSVYELPPLAFDHRKIIDYAIHRLRKKIKESDFAFQLMPDEFTLTELQKAYETILGTDIDKRNFRKKISELHILKDLHKKKMEGVHRPAALYSFVREK